MSASGRHGRAEAALRSGLQEALPCADLYERYMISHRGHASILYGGAADIRASAEPAGGELEVGDAGTRLAPDSELSRQRAPWRPARSGSSRSARGAAACAAMLRHSRRSGRLSRRGRGGAARRQADGRRLSRPHHIASPFGAPVEDPTLSSISGNSRQLIRINERRGHIWALSLRASRDPSNLYAVLTNLPAEHRSSRQPRGGGSRTLARLYSEGTRPAGSLRRGAEVINHARRDLPGRGLRLHGRHRALCRRLRAPVRRRR